MSKQIILDKQDLTYLDWSISRNSSGTAGSFLKSYEDINGKKKYYKLSDYDPIRGVVGHESINEIIVDRLLSIFGVDHLHYQLINADVCVNSEVFSTFVCASENFKLPNESKSAFDVFFQLERFPSESKLDFCLRHGWDEYVYEMFVVDFIILNRDRHGANIEVLQNQDTQTIRLAPLFDHGLSLLFSVKNDEKTIERFDVMQDRRVQCFFGSNSTLENLKLIPKDKLPAFSPLKETHREIIFQDLDDVISKTYQEKIWEMIWKRWQYYEDFCNKK